jgi:transposase-like protein
MPAIEGYTAPSSEYVATGPARCPSCGRSMRLTRSTPRAGLPDLQTFKCGECYVWLSESADAPVWRETRLVSIARRTAPSVGAYAGGRSEVGDCGAR